MASKDYHFDHELELDEATLRTEAELKRLAQRYGLKLVPGEAGFYRLTGAGVEADVHLSDHDLLIRLKLGFLLESTLRGRIEKTLCETMSTLFVS